MFDDLDRRAEGQTVGLQHGSGAAVGVADNRGEHDAAVDIIAAPAGRCRGSVQNAAQVIRDRSRAGVVGGKAVAHTSDMVRGVGFQAIDIDTGGGHDEACIVVLGQGEQKMFERDFDVLLGPRIVSRQR